ncbi:MAG: hypothetical protein AAFN41_00275, partial [Planctomycetota bacterium]
MPDVCEIVIGIGSPSSTSASNQVVANLYSGDESSSSRVTASEQIGSGSVLRVASDEPVEPHNYTPGAFTATVAFGQYTISNEIAGLFKLLPQMKFDDSQLALLQSVFKESVRVHAAATRSL